MSTNEPLRAKSGSEGAREVSRERYRPDRIHLLFVGEAPPASGRFFYHADSGLYRAIRTAFITALPALENTELLQSFQALGCYLVDLCAEPVDRLGKKERMRVCTEGEGRLARTIKRLQPRTVITDVRSISTNVKRAEQLAHWIGLHIDLSYPGRWRHHQVAFQEALSPILRTELSRVAHLSAFHGWGRTKALLKRTPI